jgi:STE24 endopeptidase
MATTEIIPVLADSAESRRYNRIKRWLGLADFILGFGLLVVLLATGWTGWLRDLAERGAAQNYFFAVFLYVLMLMLISKVIGAPLEYYGFRLEHRYNLSNQKFRSWLWDECKGLLLGLVIAAIIVELLYKLIRETPQHWWLIAWAVFLGLFVLLAQLAPVVLFPIFYKFEPL